MWSVWNRRPVVVQMRSRRRSRRSGSVLDATSAAAVSTQLMFSVIVVFVTLTPVVHPDSRQTLGTKQSTLEFHDLKQGEFANSLTSYEISIPTKINEFGDHVSHTLRHFLAPKKEFERRRRDTSSVNDVHYKVKIAGEDVHLELTANDRLFGPGLIVEHRNSTYADLSSAIRGRRISDNRCHFSGQVKGRPQSAAAIATCNGLHGLIRIGEEDYFIEPVRSHGWSSEGSGHPHLIYRRSALPAGLHLHPGRLGEAEQKRRSHGSCGVTDEQSEGDRLLNSKPRQNGGSGKSRRKRSVSLERSVETLVVVDKDMVDYYKNEDIENYVFTIMNMVSTMFHDASIGNAVNIVLVKIIYLESEERDLKITHHADHTLSSFCKWQMNINPKDDKHPNHHDVAILFTRVNICSRINEPCSTLGLSQVSGLCQPHRSCNINEDTGLALAFTVTHELGHNFGMKHDTLENGCDAPTTTDDDMQYVMSPQLTAEASPLVWSNCSRNAITVFLDRDWGHCLDDPPSAHDFNFPILPAGVMYDIDHQCRLQYGPDAEYCDGIDNLCTTVWCRVDKKCLTRLEAAAEGTICGDNEWCFGGRCIAIGEKPLAIDSQWGEWSPWSECTRSCSAGVSYSERLCNNPPPSHGGKYCLGERRRYRICNTENCPDGSSPTFRHHQCAEFNSIPYKGHKYQWEPVSTHGTPCQLHCKPRGRLFSVMMRDMVVDGTPCSIGRKDMCISGRCRTVGCDWVIDSDAKEDRCGVCHGVGTSCKTVHEDFKKESGLGYVEAAVIPEGARNIRVEEVAEANNYLAIRNDRGHYYLNGHWYIQWSGNYEAAGTVIQYLREGNKESFVAPGPISEPLHIMLLFQSQNPGVKLEYTIPAEDMTEKRQPEFHWKYSDWSHCTMSCGGGSQISEVVCVEKEAGIVDDSNCDFSTRPDDLNKPCNEHRCPARWWSGPWQHCSVSCGEEGLQKRTVLCVRPLRPDEQIALEDWECEGLEKPAEAMPCRRTDPCPVEDSQWETGPWIGKCELDEACGSQKRHVKCLDESGSCDSQTKPSSERPCPKSACGKWMVSHWSPCTRSCDGGTQFRSVSCFGGEACNRQLRPRGDQPCNTHGCPRHPSNDAPFDNGALVDQTGFPPTVTPHFQIIVPVTDEFSARETLLHLNSSFLPTIDGKSEEDGKWTTTPPAVETGAELPPDHVTDRTPPTTTTSGAMNFRWMSEYWTECSKLCGEGYRTRKVHCIRILLREVVPDDFCLGQTKPNNRETCIGQPCIPWSTTPWQPCSVTCGEGYERRKVSCLTTKQFCDPDEKPEEERICRAERCAQWMATDDWLQCSKTCGGGRQVRAVRCIDRTTHQPTTDDQCIDGGGGGSGDPSLLQPTPTTPLERQCNTQECPPSPPPPSAPTTPPHPPPASSPHPAQLNVVDSHRRVAPCSSDMMAEVTCLSLRRMGKCALDYIQRRCCRSCRSAIHRPHHPSSVAVADEAAAAPAGADAEQLTPAT